MIAFETISNKPELIGFLATIILCFLVISCIRWSYLISCFAVTSVRKLFHKPSTTHNELAIVQTTQALILRSIACPRSTQEQAVTVVPTNNRLVDGERTSRSSCGTTGHILKSLAIIIIAQHSPWMKRLMKPHFSQWVSGIMIHFISRGNESSLAPSYSLRNPSLSTVS